MHVTLIHNPNAGDDSHPDAAQLTKLIEKAGHQVRYQSSKDKKWPEVLAKSSDLVVVAGGDGTVARVARALIGKKLPLTALSMGTANNISTSLGITGLSIEEQIAGWHKARKAELDAGIATGPWGERHFIEGVGMGLFAWIMPRATKDKKLMAIEDADAAIAYALTMFRKRLGEHPAKRVTASLDGVDISGDYLLFEAMNMQYIGPNLYLAPKGRPNDGFLDIVVVSDNEREEMDKYLAHWQKRRLTPPEFPTFRGRHLQIVYSDDHSLHMDDKLMLSEESKPGSTSCHIDVKILPGALQFLMPA